MSNDPFPKPYSTSPTQSARDFEDDQPRTGNNGRCLLYGCMGIFLGGIFLILCGGFGAYYFFNQQLEKFTDTTPMDLPDVAFSDEEVQEIESRIVKFQELIETEDAAKDQTEPEVELEVQIADSDEAEKPPRELVLTANDLNTLIAAQERTRGHLFVRIEDGTISGDLSAPLGGILPGGSGRYFNGSGTFDVRLDNGNLFVTMEEGTVKGKPIPDQFMNEIRKQNLAREFNLDPRGAQFIEQFDQIDVEGDKVIITLKDPSRE